MRQLFLPACVCLMTWSSSTGTTDPRLSLEQFTGRRVVDRNHTAGGNERPRIPAAVRAGVMPVAADSGTSAATTLEHIKRTDIAALSPHAGDWSSFESPQLMTPPPPPPLAAKPVIHRSREQVCNTVAKAAHENNLPAPFFIRLLFQESRFDPASVSHAGALGIAQFMPETAADVGLDNPFDPIQAISASARLLRTLVGQFGNLGLAAAAYNAGPKRIRDWLSKKGKLPEETQGYVKIITGKPAESWKKIDAGHPEMRLPRRAPCQKAAFLYAWNPPVVIPLPRAAPRRQAARLAVAATKKDEQETARRIARPERKVAALAVMKAVITHSEGSLQLAARRENKRHKDKNKK